MATYQKQKIDLKTADSFELLLCKHEIIQVLRDAFFSYFSLPTKNRKGFLRTEP
jgi:hypothetical protein